MASQTNVISNNHPKQVTMISILLFIIQTNSILSLQAVPESHPPVLDVAGKMLRAGINYYILPAIIVGTDIGGGITLCNDTCPPQVIQDNYEFTDGIPVTFSPSNLKTGIIRVALDVNIKFSGTTNCAGSLVWRRRESDASSGQHYVSVGGIEGNPGPRTLENWFKIESYKLGYKLTFCPSVCKFCKVICGDIGVVMEKGKRRLALSDTPFEVVFKKA